MTETITLVPFGWPIAVYLSLAALAAGSAVVGSWLLASGARGSGRASLLITLGAILVGMFFLVADLEAPQRFLLVLLHFNPASIIAWGARAIVVLAVLAAFLWLRTARQAEGARPPVGLRVGLVVYAAVAIFVGLYPAWVLGQMTARPLWDSPFMAPLFLVSALHAGVAAWLLVWRRKDGPVFGLAVEAGLVGLQAVLLALIVAGFGDAYVAAQSRILTGGLAPMLWLGVVLVGWIVPILLSRRPDDRPRGLALRALAILVGVFALRALLVFVGQGTEALFVASLGG